MGLLGITPEAPNMLLLQHVKWFCNLGKTFHETTIKASHAQKSMQL
jgi:hypothetical protein